MRISPDSIVFWEWTHFSLNATVVYTWVVMVALTLGAWLITRRLTDGVDISHWQNLLEVLVTGLRDQIHEIGGRDPGPYLPFVGTLFVFIATCNLLAVVPGFIPPTGSLSTTVGLALTVFVAVPAYGVSQEGLGRYLSNYARPSVFMLPFNVLGEVSRTIALAVRLYGNVMSGTVIVAILLGLAPFFFPIVMQMLGLLTGLIQAYIFAVLATVYITSATASRRAPEETEGASRRS